LIIHICIISRFVEIGKNKSIFKQFFPERVLSSFPLFVFKFYFLNLKSHRQKHPKPLFSHAERQTLKNSGGSFAGKQQESTAYIEQNKNNDVKNETELVK